MNYVDEVLEHCENRGASDKAPHVPNAGAPAASVSNDVVQVLVFFPGDFVALRSMDMSSKYSMLLQVQSKTLTGYGASSA